MALKRAFVSTINRGKNGFRANPLPLTQGNLPGLFTVPAYNSLNPHLNLNGRYSIIKKILEHADKYEKIPLPMSLI